MPTTNSFDSIYLELYSIPLFGLKPIPTKFRTRQCWRRFDFTKHLTRFWTGADLLGWNGYVAHYIKNNTNIKTWQELVIKHGGTVTLNCINVYTHIHKRKVMTEGRPFCLREHILMAAEDFFISYLDSITFFLSQTTNVFCVFSFS